MTPYLGLLLLLAGQRLSELRISARNARWAAARGGLEFGRGHLRPMQLLHAAFLCACALEVTGLGRPFRPSLGWLMLAIVVLAQGLRVWTMYALGRSWNARVVVVPGTLVVTGGPYRFLRHPNYLAVVLEGIAVPLVHGAWLTATVFTVLNGLLLVARIRCEERALAAQCEGVEVLQRRPRFVPRRLQLAR